MVALKQMLGSGIYTLPEAALYARVSTRMMARWIFGNDAGEPVISPEFGVEDKVISFLDLIQTLAIREIRLQKKIPLGRFRQAIRVAKDSFSLDFPFARRHTTYLYGTELVIRPYGSDSDEFVEASGKHRGQRLFPFVEMYLQDLDFAVTGLANSYRIYKWDEVTITMNPNIRFGEPLLPSGYTASAIFEAIKAEGGLDRAAEVYGIPKEEVQASYKFFDHLSATAA